MKASIWRVCAIIVVASVAAAGSSGARAEAPKGEIKGTAFVHTAESARDLIQHASVALPEVVMRGASYLGQWKDIPATFGDPVPVVVFLHGSSGLSLKAIGEWQKWLATLGIASVAPDSFALPDRITYTSPIAKDVYEHIHALRSSEIPLAVAALKGMPWADHDRIALAGASEAGPAVARYDGREFVARIIYAWSCENNYFVNAHDTRVVEDQPILNVISSVDPFFSQANTWLENREAKGHCAAALAASRQATVVLVPQAPHTLMNLPQARAVTRSFLEDVFKRR